MQLKSMSLDRLMELRDKVEAELNARIAGARSELESRLKNLSVRGSPPKMGGKGPRGRVAPKYRNPENPSETWTGRGRPPRWLAAELKRGGRLEDFLIEGGPRRGRKARKAEAVPKPGKPRQAANARETAPPPQGAKRHEAGKPLKAKIARSPHAPPQAPTPAPAPTEQSEAQTPAA